MSDIVQGIVKSLTEAEIEKHLPMIRNKINAAVSKAMKSKRIEKVVESEIIRYAETYIREQIDISDWLRSKDYEKLVRRALKL